MQGDAQVKGIWIKQHGEEEPDIVIYYAHGKTLAPLCVRYASCRSANKNPRVCVCYV